MDIDALRLEAIKDKIPVLSQSGLEFLLRIIRENKYRSFLEIGSAYGTTSLIISKEETVENVVGIEKDFERFSKSLVNLKKVDISNKVSFINDDALNVTFDTKFDVIFIDASKANYQKFFDRFKGNLNKGGVIICDNMNFHGLLENPRGNKRLLKMLLKLKAFKEKLATYKTEFYDIGDGMSVTKYENL